MSKKAARSTRNRRPWTDAERAILRRNYAHFSTAHVAAQLGRTLAQVYTQAAKLGLRKSAEYLASPAACRMRRGDQDRLGGAAHRFAPGHEPWNKGTHYTAGGRSAETRFQPGRAPEAARNYCPIGSLRITKDGTLERKVTDNQALAPARRWVAVQRLVWEQHHGPIQPGHAVVFRPGRKTTDPALITHAADPQRAARRARESLAPETSGCHRSAPVPPRAEPSAGPTLGDCPSRSACPAQR